MCHGFSRVVLALLQHAVSQGVHFTVIVTEGRVAEAGLEWARKLAPLRVPVSVILDSAAAFHLDR